MLQTDHCSLPANNRTFWPLTHTFLKQEYLLSPAPSFRVTCHTMIEYQYTTALIPLTLEVPVSLVSPASCSSHNLGPYFFSPPHHTISMHNAVAKTTLVKFKGCTRHVLINEQRLVITQLLFAEDCCQIHQTQLTSEPHLQAHQHQHWCQGQFSVL